MRAAGLYQTILDGGPIISELVQMAQRGGNINERSDSPMSIGSWPDLQRAAQDRLVPISGAQALGALSARETDILKLIARGLSNKEIARSLDIGPETVKSHLKSVFTKLGVERRAQAVSRAQTLGLVTTQ